MENNFTHIHLHDYYSLLDGFSSPESICERAVELNMHSIATTNHNHLGGCLHFQKACREKEIKPLLGCELYYTEDTNMLSLNSKLRYEITKKKAKLDGVTLPNKKPGKSRKNTKPNPKVQETLDLVDKYDYNTKQFHLLFVAKNQTGWNNLVKLQSESATKCTFNGRYCCDDNLIEEYKDGLIMSTACLGGIVPQYILQNKTELAYEKLDKWRAMFNDDFYIELQPLNDENQALVNLSLINYIKSTKCNYIVTNDVHYARQEDIKDHDVLVCVGTKKTIDDPNRMRYAEDFWIRSYDEMLEAFKKQWENNNTLNNNILLDEYMDIVKIGLNSTNNIAEKVSDDIRIGYKEPMLPKVDIPINLTSERYLSMISYKSLYKYLAEHKELDRSEYEKRLEFELNVINTKGYADYMLIVKDLIDWCKEVGIPTGPGRGSAAGSLVLFVNEITKCVDPIKYGLLFSRFLTMDRTALPDCC